MNNSSVPRRDFLAAGFALGATAMVTQVTGCASASPSTSTPGAAAPAALSTAPVSQASQPPQLTMHAIDTFHGTPAAGMKVDFSIFEAGRYRLLKSFETNTGGRTGDPILSAENLKVARYEILLHVEDYFARLGAKLPAQPFLGTVPIRFAVYDASQRYHVPILFTPWSYSYYRGS